MAKFINLLLFKNLMLSYLLLGSLIAGTSCGKNQGSFKTDKPSQSIKTDKGFIQRKTNFNLKGSITLLINGKEVESQKFLHLDHSLIELNNRGYANVVHKNLELLEMFSLPKFKLLNLVGALGKDISNCEILVTMDHDKLQLFSFTDDQKYIFVENDKGMSLRFDTHKDCSKFVKFHHSYFIQLPTIFEKTKKRHLVIDSEGISNTKSPIILKNGWEKLEHFNNVFYFKKNNKNYEVPFEFSEENLKNITRFNFDDNKVKSSVLKISFEQNIPIRERFQQRVNADFRSSRGAGTFAKICNVEHFRVNENNWRPISYSSFLKRDIHFIVPENLISKNFNLSKAYEIDELNEGMIFINQLSPNMELSYGFDNEYDCSRRSVYGYNIRDIVDRNKYTKLTKKQVRMNIKVYSWK
ncbi:MAG: hypothetical protein GY909_04020 [Oligoflexia bacterium]|nr:hypothetical protein [Oligoflexia bacterium]